MLNRYRNISCKYRYGFFDKNVRITLFFYLVYKFQNINRLYVYNGKELNEKKISLLDIGNIVGEYALTRKPYKKPEKFFRFKY